MKLNLSPDVLALNPGMGRAITVAGDKKAEKRARVPRADADEITGLKPLLVAGWSVESPDAIRYRLYRFGTSLDTGLCETLKLACDTAKGLSK